jgi:uncharacterized protein (DUF2336 family)
VSEAPHAVDLVVQSGQLLSDDIERLTQDPSPTTRAFHAVRAGAALEQASLSDEQREAALELVRRFARDAENMVRVVLAERIKSCALLPRDLALQLTQDIEQVAIPIIEYAAALTDADLVEIVRCGDPARQTAVARRRIISPAVSEMIADTAAEPAVTALIRNEHAALTADGFARAAQRFPYSSGLAAAIEQRADLPIGAIERIFCVASESIRRALLCRDDVSEELIDRVVLSAREAVTVQSLSIGADTEHVDALVQLLNERHRLTPTIIMRALLGGDTQFFMSAMAICAGVTVTTVKILIQDAGPLGLRALYGKTALPESYFPVVRAAVDAIVEGQRRHTRQPRRALAMAILAKVQARVDTLSNEALDLLADPYLSVGSTR